jgi:tRNA/tmRNA/rRNA uracil-C5-methylase (TrmA/RlmC/RlmD family)
MTRDEQIENEARRVSYNIDEYSSFIQVAEWADKTMIEKACEWLLNQEEMIGVSFEDDFIEFKP